MAGLEQRPGEPDGEWVVRLSSDPLFDDATVGELVRFTGVPREKVRRVRRRLRAPLRLVWEHAKAVARELDEHPLAVLHEALEVYLGLRRARRNLK